MTRHAHCQYHCDTRCHIDSTYNVTQMSVTNVLFCSLRNTTQQFCAIQTKFSFILEFILRKYDLK